MDFQLSEEQKELQVTVRRYVDERLLPVAAEIEETGEPPSHELVREFADMGYLARDYLPVVLGGELPLYEDFTYYVINPRNKVSFIRSYPGIPADSLETYPQMFSGWMPGGTRVGCWGPDTEQRLDMALKQTTVMYMQVVHGVPWKRGWLIEGVGLYVNQLVLKTRHSFQVEITRYDDPTKPNTAREMPDQSDDWLEVAGEVLAEVRPTLVPSSSMLMRSEVVPAVALPSL